MNLSHKNSTACYIIFESVFLRSRRGQLLKSKSRNEHIQNSDPKDEPKSDVVKQKSHSLMPLLVYIVIGFQQNHASDRHLIAQS
jgi:hypothetical protein